MSLIIMRLLREPLFHFLLAGAMIFVLFEAVGTPQAAPDDLRRIVVTQDQINRIAALWKKVHRRPPAAVELKGLIEDHVREEVYYREAMALGLDRNDTIIRRRLRQKMEFLSANMARLPEPSDDELTSYMRRHQNRYRIEPKAAFRHVYLKADRTRASARKEAKKILRNLKDQGPDADITALGDRTLLPGEIPLSQTSEIARLFGKSFADDVIRLAIGKWAGPIRSAYGLHLVLVQQRTAGRLPDLSKIRDAVKRDWLISKKEDLEEESYKGLRQAYEVSIEWPRTAQSSGTGQE